MEEPFASVRLVNATPRTAKPVMASAITRFALGVTPAQCALSKCWTEASACLADAGCKTKVTCALACTTKTCIDGCAGASPDAATSALVSCAVAQGCVTSSVPASAVLLE